MSAATYIAPIGNTDPDHAQATLRKIAAIALCAIVLGFVIQAVLLGAKLAAANNVAWANVVVDVTGGIAWALLVCTGVGISTSIAKARPLLAGLLAMICAPISIALAKSSQKLMAGLIAAAEQEAVLSLSAISVMRAVEYGVLGWMLGRLVQRSEDRASRYVAVGLLVGAIFGGVIAYVTHQVALSKGLTPGAPQIASSIINEVVFPIGCAFVIYIGQLIGRSVKAIGN